MQNTGHAKSQKGVTAENGLRPFNFFTRCNEYYTNPKGGVKKDKHFTCHLQTGICNQY